MASFYVDRLDAQGARRRPLTATSRTRKRLLDPKQRVESRIYNLTLDANALRQQVQQLRTLRELLYARTFTTARDGDGSCIRTVDAYLELFRHGVDGLDDAAGLSLRPAQQQQQRAFLDSVADERLSLGVTGQLGRAALLEQWCLYTQYFAVRESVFDSLQVVVRDELEGTCVVRADGVIHGTFTMDALALVFPAVLHDPELTQELLGQPLAAPGILLLYFDRDGRLVRHDSATDFFATLSTALGDPRRAARVLASAKIADEGMLAAPE